MTTDSVYLHERQGKDFMKKLWLILIAVVMLVGMVMLIPQNAKALTEGVFTYTVSGGKATITACSTTTGDVVVPSTLGDYPVTSIGNTVFYNRSGLTSVTISEGITSIGNSVFEKCSGLTSVVIPSSLTSIGNYAFKGCTKLTSVVIPDSVTKIGNSAFNGCSGLTSISISNNVTSIGDYVFNGCTGLTSVVIPAGVTSIGAGAFYKCSALNNVEIPSSVTSIGNYAFQYCSSLANVYYAGNKVEWKSIIIGSNNECLTNATIIYEEEVPEEQNPDYLTYTVENGEVTITDCDISISGKLVIPSIYSGYPVTSIGDYAFEDCSSLTSVEIPEGITSIGDYAFEDCVSLISIEIPDGVMSIGLRSFYNTAYYNNTDNWEDEGLYIESYLLCAKEQIGDAYEIKIKPGTILIADSAFSCFSSLVDVEIPDSVTIIGDCAFQGCVSLGDISIPDSITSIGDGAFSECYCLESISIPDSVTSMGDWVFSVTGLKSIEIPNSITSIGDSAFYRCNNLTSISIPNSITSIGLGAFSNCENLTSVVIPENVTSIGDCAFEYCYSLTTVYYSGTAEEWAEIEIGGSNEDLTNATFIYNYVQDPDYLTYIVENGKVTITDCDESVSGKLVIPSTLGGCPVTSIGVFAFENCINLTSVVIPEGVTSIGERAFYDCDSLTSIEISSSVTEIGDFAFGACWSLTSVEIPDSVTSIGWGAFAYCGSLTSVVIPEGVTIISEETFNLCEALTSVEIPASVTSIGMGAFYECYDLASISIPASVTSIGDIAFGYCTSLTSVEIPASVTSIGGGAFYDCYSLMNVYYAGTSVEWSNINIDSGNECLLNAELVFLGKSELEKALDGKGVTVGKLANETEVVIVPTVSGNVAMTEAELAEMLGDDITIISNNGIIGTGCKIIVGEQEVEIAVKGDIDGDGIATVFDALMVKKALANNSFIENDIREFAGDIDGEGVTDSADVDAILAHIVGEMLIA